MDISKSFLKQFLTSIVFIATFGYGNQNQSEQLSSRKKLNREVDKQEIIRITNDYPQPYRSLNRDNFFSVLIDSSKNGYGNYLPTNDPLTYNPDYGFAMIYRKWQGLEESSGYVGVAESGTGSNWFTSYPINENLPDGTPMASGRYPSIVMGSDGTKFAVWNEYTPDCSGGGSSCGRLFFSFNQDTWYIDYPNDDMLDLNNGCAILPCDPPDLWQAQPHLIETEDYWYLYTVSSSWSGGGLIFIKTSIEKSTGIHTNTEPVTIPITNNGIFEMNQTGQGAITRTTNSTIEYSMTTDFGLTWSELISIPDALLAQGFADIGFPQSNNRDFFQNHDSHIDQNGGLHVFTGVDMSDDDTTNYFHFYNPTPDDQNSWIINHVTDITESYDYNYTTPDGSSLESGDSYLFPGVSFSSWGSDVIWFVCNKISEYDENGYADVDIYLYKSENFGSSWTEIGNLTNTADGHHIESYVHAAPLSTDISVSFMYAIPDLDVATISPVQNYADFKHLVYFGFYGGFEAGSENLVINEIMQNPSTAGDDSGEWFEIYNAGEYAVPLQGYSIKDAGTDIHTIEENIVMFPGEFKVFGNDFDSGNNGGLTIDYQYSDISLGNGSDELIILDPNGMVIDSVGWDNGSTFPDPDGASIALFDTDLDNSSGSNWTVSVTPYGDGDLGTPGIPNFNPTILVSEEEIIFTDVMVGLSDTYNLEITNIGNGGLIIDTVFFDNDAFNSSFTTALVEVGDPILLPIIFTPLALETYSATIFIKNNDYNNQVLSIALLGYGIEPNPNIYISPNTLDFGVVTISDSGYVEFTIHNIGVNDLEIDEVEFALGDGSPFFTDFGEATVEGGSSISGSIGYLYTEQRVAIQDTFYVYSNDPDQSMYNVPIIVTTPTNNPPIITSDDNVTVNEDSYFMYRATAEDPDDSTIIYSFIDLASWLTADADSVYGTPSDGDADTSFLVIASDGELGDSLIVFIDVIHINDPPNEFALLTPEAESMIQTLTPLFEWGASFDPDLTDTVGYTLFYGDSIPALQIIEVGTELSYQVSSDLNDNSTYYWEVIADDQSGAFTENIGGYQSFYTNVSNDPPSVATLITPTENSIEVDLTPIFYWTESLDPDPMDHISYTMNWWPMGLLPVIYSADTDSNSFTPEENLTDNSQFGWMVTANDMHGAESNSDSSYFYTDALPEPPLNFATVTPANNAEGIANEVEFIWNETDDPDPVEEIHYQLVYATDWADSSTYVFSELLEDTSLTLTLEDNSHYYWIVVAMDTDGFMVGSNENTPNTMVVGTLSIDGADIPEVFALHQNYPNPFNPTTQIRYDLPEDALVSINIYDLMGRSIKSLVNSNQSAGYRSIQWNATNDLGEPVSAGMYIYMIQAGEFRQTKKMVLLK
jgi:hypothetical protein